MENKIGEEVRKMKRKVLFAALLGTAFLAAGCGKKEAQTEKATEAAVETEAESKTQSGEETEGADTEAAATEEAAEASGAAGGEDTTEADSEAADTEADSEAVDTEKDTEAAEGETEEAEAELGERPDYTALDYVTLGEYKGLSVMVEPITIAESEIDDSIEGEVANQEKYDHRTDGVVAEGDMANIDFEGKKDGVAFDGGTSQGYDLTIGSGAFIDGFEEGLVGVKVGDTVDLNLTFPENYQSEELAGQDVVFTVTVNYVEEMPEITDELVSELSDGAYSTVDGYREYMRGLLQENKEQEREYTIYQDLMTQLYNTCTINEYPQDLVDYSVAAMNQTYESYAAMYGMGLEDFVTATGLTMDGFKETVLENVKQNLQQELILKAIAEQEDLLISEEEYAEGAANYAAQYQYESTEAFEEDYDRDIIEISLLMDKVLLYVKDNALVEEIQETETETEAASEADSTEAITEDSQTEAGDAASEASTEAETEAGTEAAAEAGTESNTEA